MDVFGGQFELVDDDFVAIEIAKETIRKLLRGTADLSGAQVTGLGRALDALERMPNIVPGICVDLGLAYTHEHDGFSETSYFGLTIMDDCFEMSRGGSVYDPAVGSDNLPGQRYQILVGGHGSGDLDLHGVVDFVDELLGLGGRVWVQDESWSPR